jgi:hypothetical protein
MVQVPFLSDSGNDRKDLALVPSKDHLAEAGSEVRQTEQQICGQLLCSVPRPEGGKGTIRSP